MVDDFTGDILIVDDEKFIRTLIGRIMEDLGYRAVHQADSGKEALRILRREKGAIRVIFLDIEMEEMSGHEVLDELRNNPNIPNNKVPVIMLTGLSDRNNIVKAAELGIHGYLTKPCSIDRLKKAIHQALHKDPIDPEAVKKAVGFDE